MSHIELTTPDLLPSSVKPPRPGAKNPDDEPPSSSWGSMRPTGHVRNFVWWLGIVAIALGVFHLGSAGPIRVSEPRVVKRDETEAFVALRLPRVREGAERGEISPQRLRELLGALDERGYSTIGFDDIEDFYEKGTPLPTRPIMIIVPEAWRETVELADEVLASLRQGAVVFVDVNQVERVNLSLVSRMRLTQLAQTGHWQVGLATCTSPIANEVPTADQLQAERVALESWLETRIAAADCKNGLPDTAKDPWENALRSANLSIGFIRGRSTANFRRAAPLRLHAVPIGDDWRAGDIADRVAAYAPRRETYADHFQGQHLGRGWLVDYGQASVKDGMLEVTGGDRELGLLRLGGTDNWRDAQIETTLAGRPRGQFWIYARRRATNPFVRLGVIGDEILFQRSEEGGGTRQLARLQIPRGQTTLTLRIIGDRAVAFVDGRRIVERPVDVPPSLHFGPVSLAVWGEQPGEATAKIASFRAEPLPRMTAMLAPVPTTNQWSELHRRVDTLAEVSPSIFRWENGKGREVSRPDDGLAIFAHYHRLSLRPAVLIESPIGASDIEPLQKQLVEWAKDPMFDGLNLVVRETVAPSPDLHLATAVVRSQLRAAGKELSLTVVAANDSPLPTNLARWQPFRTDRAVVSSDLRIATAG